MSNKTIDAVKHCSKAKGGLRLLLVMIADGVSKDTDLYDAKIETLMADTNYDRRFVQRLVSRGIAAGELVTFPRGNRNSAFQIPMLEGEPGYDPQDCPEYARWQAGEAPDHYCNGRHTPLSINREEEYRVLLGEKRSLRRRATKKPGRSIDRTQDTISERSIDHPAEETPSQSGLLTTLQRSIDHPAAVDRPPQSGLLTAHYPSGTLVITHDVPEAPPSQLEKMERAGPDPEADPPRLRDTPPTFGEFASTYRKQPGKGILTRYSEIRAAYRDTFGMTPEQAAELRAEVNA